MSFVQITPTTPTTETFALFSLGFRPFFIGAAACAVASIGLWLLVYAGQLPVATTSISLFEWHAHQMIYGFSMAVIAGFLLTAIMNWTGVRTLQGVALKVLVFCWAVPRVALLFGTAFIEIAALFDLLFLTGLMYGITAPIVAARQWKQAAILTIVLLLAIGNILFYLDAFTFYPDGAFIGIYGGLFLIISLILTIGGRVMPAFIRNGLAQPVRVTNPSWVATTSAVIFIVFIINYLFLHSVLTTGITAALLFALTSYRLACWHTPGIWSHPLLWGLFVSYICIDVGFLLFALQAFVPLSPFLPVHAFGYGGIGLATLAMMSRVSLGHTGRSIKMPPRGTGVLLIALLSGAVVRVLGPLLAQDNYLSAIVISQVLWILAFAGFIALFGRMLVLSRADGRPD